MKCLNTKRLVLRPMTDAQLLARSEAAEDAHLREAYRQMLALCTADPKNRLFATAWQIATWDGAVIGDGGFKGAPKNGEVELGYGIDAPFRGKGYAEEAARALVGWAFSQNGVDLVSAETAPDNAASQHILQKLGFLPAGSGAEGPRFSCARRTAVYTPWFLLTGAGLGFCFGAAFGNSMTGLITGAAVGLILGAALDGYGLIRRRRNAAARRMADASAPR